MTSPGQYKKWCLDEYRILKSPPLCCNIKFFSPSSVFKYSVSLHLHIKSQNGSAKNISDFFSREIFSLLMWPFKVNFFFDSSCPQGPFCQKGSRVLGGHERSKRNWPWKCTVSRSYKLGPTFQEKSDIFICRSLSIISWVNFITIVIHKTLISNPVYFSQSAQRALKQIEEILSTRRLYKSVSVLSQRPASPNLTRNSKTLGKYLDLWFNTLLRQIKRFITHWEM